MAVTEPEMEKIANKVIEKMKCCGMYITGGCNHEWDIEGSANTTSGTTRYLICRKCSMKRMENLMPKISDRVII